MNPLFIPLRIFRYPFAIIIAVLISTSILICTAQDASAAVTLLSKQRLAQGTVVPRGFFGLHIHRAGSATLWPEVPFGAWRLWDAYTAWPNLEPQKGLWNFERLDKYIALGETAKVELLLPLGLSPQWASSRPNEKSAYEAGNAAEPLNIQDWRDYVRTVVTRYKGRIHYYEIWNEPNLKMFYTGSVATMVNLVREAAAIVHEVDPSARVVAPSPTGSYGVDWFQSFLKKGGGEHVDIFGYHFYVTPKPPEKMLPIITKVQKVKSKYGFASKPVWNTEAGWTFPASLNLSDDKLAAYVVRSFVINWASGIDRFFWYSWDNGDRGLVDNGGYVVKSGGKAYANVMKWLEGARMNSFVKAKAGTYIAEISKGDNYRGWILWNPSKTVRVKLPAAWDARTVTTISGQIDTVKGLATYMVGQSPLLIDGPLPVSEP